MEKVPLQQGEEVLLRMDFPRGNPKDVVLPEETRKKLCAALPVKEEEFVRTAFCAKTRKLVVEVSAVYYQ